MTRRPRTPINERALLRTKDAADYLSISDRTLRDHVSSGDIKPIRYSDKMFRFRRTDLDRLIDMIADGETHLQRMKALA